MLVDHLASFLEAARSAQPVHTRATIKARGGGERTVIVSYTSMASAMDGLELGIASIREVPADAAVTVADSREAALSMLGHELRSPLTAIMGYAGLMRREAQGAVDPARQAEYVDRIAASGDYMLRLVNNMLDLRRMESGAEQLQPTPIRLDRILQVVLGLARLGATEKRIETSLSVAPNMEPFVTDELLVR